MSRTLAISLILNGMLAGAIAGYAAAAYLGCGECSSLRVFQAD
jgi:hypothetical protein